MQVVYQSGIYDSREVTGRYVCVKGRKGNYIYRVFETTGKEGKGPTLREYETSGEELPLDLKYRCVCSKHTEKWD